MKVLILADIEASGEWLAIQNLLKIYGEEITGMEYFLVGYGSNNLMVEDRLFKKIVLMNPPVTRSPFRHVKEIIAEVVNGMNVIRQNIPMKDIDLILISDYRLFIPVKIISRQKVRYLFHGFHSNYILTIFNFNLYLFTRILLERVAMIFSDSAVTPSLYAKKEFIKITYKLKLPDYVEVIPNQISDDFFRKYSRLDIVKFKKKYKLPLNKKIVVYSGIISERKGLLELVKAFKRFSGKNRNWKLVIAYLSFRVEKPYFIRLKRITGKSVRFLSDLKQSELSLLYHSSDLAVLPSRYETFGNSILEALLSGVPIISTNVGVLKDNEYYQKSVILLENVTEKDIYEKLVFFDRLNRSKAREMKRLINKFNTRLKMNISADKNYIVRHFL